MGLGGLDPTAVLREPSEDSSHLPLTPRRLEFGPRIHFQAVNKQRKHIFFLQLLIYVLLSVFNNNLHIIIFNNMCNITFDTVSVCTIIFDNAYTLMATTKYTPLNSILLARLTLFQQLLRNGIPNS